METSIQLLIKENRYAGERFERPDKIISQSGFNISFKNSNSTNPRL